MDNRNFINFNFVQIDFKNLGCSTKSSLERLYILEQALLKLGTLDEFYLKQIRGIKILLDDLTLENIPDSVKLNLDKEVSRFISQIKMEKRK